MANDIIAHSKFWDSLWEHYHRTPSIALCRVPELEYASSLSLSGATLDHCCGDGVFAEMAWPQETFSAGCDWSEEALENAKRRGRHERLDVCDAGKALPYDDERFDLVFDNSALEHIPDLDGAMHEIRRVTKIGGRYAMNVLNRRFFDWWPMGESSRNAYAEAQPIHHLLTIDEWRKVFKDHGFELEEVQGYFHPTAARAFGLLDYEFSLSLLKAKRSLLVVGYRRLASAATPAMKFVLGRLSWRTEPYGGAGCFLVARRVS